MRNDYLIRLMMDAAAAREGGEDVEVPIEECWGESCPDYPILGARITHDEAGRKLDEFERRKAGYEEIYPDGRFRVEWPSSALWCVFDLELELHTRTSILADKLDARAAAWLRAYEDHRKAVQQVHRRRKENPYFRLPDEIFSGLGPTVAPLIVIMESSNRAKSMRDRLLERYRHKKDMIETLQTAGR